MEDLYCVICGKFCGEGSWICKECEENVSLGEQEWPETLPSH